jgi:parallel beta-helix repeat protein
MKKGFYRMRPAVALAFAVLICLAGTVSAQTTKWVDQINGSDSNSGDTEATAYASLQTALNNSQSGTAATRSIIYVKNGDYAAAGLTNPGGSNTAILAQNLDYLTIQAVAGHAPKVKPLTAGTVSLSIVNCQHLIVDGIASDQMIALADNWQVFSANNLSVRNCTFNGGQRGIKFSSTSNTVLVEKSAFININLLNTSDALEFLQASYSNVVIQDNMFQNNTRHVRLHEQAGNTISDFTIRRNSMVGTNGEESLRLIGAENVVIENNFVLYSGQQGIYIDTGCSNVTIRHNTFYKNGFEAIRTRITSPDVVIKNNIFYGNGTHAALAAISPLPGEDYNLIFNAGNSTETTSQPAVTSFGVNTMTNRDPLFVKTTAGSENLQLQNASPAIGAGVDLAVADDVTKGARPQPASSRPDLGAYEHSRATPENGSTANPVKIMPLGDSITQMYADHDSYRRPLWHLLQSGGFTVDFVGSQNLNKNGPPPHPDFDMDHEGHSGWRADEILTQIENWATTFQPDIVLIHLGSNDIFQYQSNSGTIFELGQIIDKLRLVNPNIKILLAQIIPSIYEANAIIDFNQRLPGLAASKNTPQSPVVVVDMWTGFSVSLDMYDGVHPNDAGDQKMAGRWYAALVNFLSNAPPPTTKWVDQIGGSDGNDGNTEATAFASLQMAINNSRSGNPLTRSIIYVKSGEYGSAGMVNPGGASTAVLIQDLDYLTIQAVPGHQPKVKPLAAGTVSISIANSRHLIVDGIASDQTVAQTDNWQVFGSSNLTVRNCAFEGGQRGINFSSTMYTVLVEKSLFKNINVLATSDALEFLNASYAEVIIQDNTFLNNKRHIRLHEQVGNTIGNFTIRRNVMNGSIGEESLRLIGASDVVIENNVIMNSGQQGLYIDLGCSNITVRHNTFFNGKFEMIRTRVTSPDVAIKNNIFYGNGTHAALAAAVSPLPGEDCNLIFNVGSATETTLQPAVTSFGAKTKTGQDPLFVSIAAGSENLRLQNGSPAIAAGINLGMTDDADRNARPQPASTQPDLGAYESALPIIAAPDIAVDPASHHFGETTIGAGKTQTIVVSNAGTANLQVTASTLSGANAAEFAVASGGAPFTLAPGATRHVVVSFKPASVGSKSANLTIASNDADTNPLIVALTGIGATATTPDIAVNPVTHSYGEVATGASAMQTIEVSNTGTAVLEVKATTLAGANAAEFSIQSGGAPFILASGASRELVVRFRPASAGAKSATLTLSCNDPDENPVQVRLAGSGRASSSAISYMLLAANKIELKGQKKSEGIMHSNNEISFNDGYGSIHTGNLTAGGKLTIKNGNTINGDIKAGDELKIESNATINGQAAGYTSVGQVTLPSLSFSAGGANVNLGAKRSRSLEPGSYGQVKMGNGGVLLLRHNGVSGKYFFKKLELKDKAVLAIDIANGPVTIHVVDQLHLDKHTAVKLTPSGDNGSAWVTFNCLRDVVIEEGAKILGAIVAPGNKVELKKRVLFKGSITAGEIVVGEYATVLSHQSTGSLTKESFLEAREAGEAPPAAAITSFALAQNYPNPFNPSTAISFVIPEAAQVMLQIYDVRGQLVKTLVDRMLAAGRHQVIWHGDNASGQQVASGVYFYRMQAGSFSQSKTMLLVR